MPNMADISELYEYSEGRLARTATSFVRGKMDEIAWNNRLIGLRGARGTGKTTLMLQRMKKMFPAASEKALYAALDNVWFSGHSLNELVDTFVKHGGTHLFLDEVHKYPNWPQLLKNFYDDYPDLNVVFTGSSLLEIIDSRADLSRRALLYSIQGLSFREYIAIKEGIEFPIYSLQDIVTGHAKISANICQKIKPLACFSDYLTFGYYPYFTEGIDTYNMRLNETVSMILEMELPLLRRVEMSCVPKIKRLLGVIAQSAPFIPNISKLAGQIGITRQTLLTYLTYLQEANLIKNLYKNAAGLSVLQKPDKIYLENTNLMRLFMGKNVNVGNMRETFLANQLSYGHTIEYPVSGDFLVDKKYLFEVGGKNKTEKQLKQERTAEYNGYIAADDVEYGYANKIPLWLFGFMY
jgi:predicted AAA+ superfamily ATPase